MWYSTFFIVFLLQNFSVGSSELSNGSINDVSQPLLTTMSNHILTLIKTFETNSKVFITDRDDVIIKLSKLVEDGESKLQIIADFDWTLTKSNVDGVPTVHSYDILALLPVLNKTYQEKKDEYFKKYVKLLTESDDDDEKHRISKQWFDEHEKLILGVNISVEDLKEVVLKANVPLRDGCTAYLEMLASHDIPLSVLSSGIGDIIQQHLKQQGVEVNSTVANFLNMENNVVQGFKEPFISTYSKDRISFPVEYDRPNIILIGDALEDHKMGDSISNKKTVLKIGFCPGENKVENYHKYFDIVLVNDQTMDIIKAITSLLFKNHKTDEL